MYVYSGIPPMSPSTLYNNVAGDNLVIARKKPANQNSCQN